MTKYLLTCGCGATLPVDVGQAGERVACQCGATLEVPPLRKLRHLPVAPIPVEASASWNARRGIVATLIILAAIPALIALWSRLTEPKVATFEPAAYTRNVEERLKTISPLQAWQLWVQHYRPMGELGFFQLVDPHTAAIDQEVAKRRFLQGILLVTAVVLMAFAAIAAFWPRSQARRQGDKETRSAR
ncbi:MAG TPA: hypothetical protein VJ828_06865 [Lacipirellulaceae bacterium]|nr:hypothetical protein [Lacipirellulaceae bacterium]HJS07157.1 hypothetical protein [Pirellulales bacterium]